MQRRAMRPYRVAIIAEHTLFAEGVRDLLEGEPDVDVIAVLESIPESAKEARDLSADVIVVEGALEGSFQEVWPALERYAIGIKIVVASTQCNRLDIVYHQRVQTSTPSDLLAAVRQPLTWGAPPGGRLYVLCTSQGKYGERIIKNLKTVLPPEWRLDAVRLPPIIPTEIENPADFIPPTLPAADLVIGLGEGPGAALLLPEIVRLSGAQAVIVPIDRSEWIPSRVQTELEEAFTAQDIATVFPRPFCSLTEVTYNHTPHVRPYYHTLIAAFARYVGHPLFRLTTSESAVVERVSVERDAPCGCGQNIAEQLVGCPTKALSECVTAIHADYPCMAGLSVDGVYSDTLRHVASAIFKESVLRMANVDA
jgi:hypothetical protein